MIVLPNWLEQLVVSWFSNTKTCKCKQHVFSSENFNTKYNSEPQTSVSISSPLFKDTFDCVYSDSFNKHKMVSFQHKFECWCWSHLNGIAILWVITKFVLVDFSKSLETFSLRAPCNMWTKIHYILWNKVFLFILKLALNIVCNELL